MTNFLFIPSLGASAEGKTKLSFSYRGGFPANVADQEIYEIGGILNQIPVPRAGSIVILELYSLTPIVAGTLLAEPTIDGIKTPDDLDLSLSAGNPYLNKEIVKDKAGFIFTSGKKVGIMLTSSIGWNNNLGDIFAALYIQI